MELDENKKMNKKYKPKKHNSNDENKNKMSFVYNGRRYYKTYAEALRNRRKVNRIYYDAFKKAYYIVRLVKTET